jgi:hypothetical protein
MNCLLMDLMNAILTTIEQNIKQIIYFLIIRIIENIFKLIIN